MRTASVKRKAAPGLVSFVDHLRVTGDPARVTGDPARVTGDPAPVPSDPAPVPSDPAPSSIARSDYQRLPDGQLELIVRFDERGVGGYVVGPRMHALRKHNDTAQSFLSVRFKAGGAYPFFGRPLSSLIDQLVPLEDFWGEGAEQLSHALARAHGHDARVETLERALAHRLTVATFEPASVPAVRRAVRLLAAAPSLPSVDELAREVGSSARQLRRAFSDVVGVAPKQYLRVVRFQRALRAARRAPATPWSAIARSVGYFDQSHLHAEFVALGGATPTTLVSRGR
ncbi:MAG: hypothetical protein RLZZ450_7543 [Pseudomonadota bacterium]